MIYRNVSDAKAQLSMLIEAALKGTEVILGKAGKPLIRFAIYEVKTPKRKPGRFKGKLNISENFGEFDDELQEMFDLKEDLHK